MDSPSSAEEEEIDIDNLTLQELAEMGELDDVDMEGLEEMASEELAALEAEDLEWDQATGEVVVHEHASGEGEVLSLGSQESSLTSMDSVSSADDVDLAAALHQGAVSRFARGSKDDDEGSEESDGIDYSLPVWKRPPDLPLYQQRKARTRVGAVPKVSPRWKKQPFAELSDLSKGVRPSCERLRTATSKNEQPRLPDWHVARRVGHVPLSESMSEGKLVRLRMETSDALDGTSPPGTPEAAHDRLAIGTMHVSYTNPKADPLSIDRGRLFDRLGPNTMSLDADSFVVRAFSSKPPMPTRRYPGLVKPERNSAEVAIMNALIRRPVDEREVKGQDARDGTARKAVIDTLKLQVPPPPVLRPSAGLSLTAPCPAYPRQPDRKAKVKRLKRLVRRRRRRPGKKQAASLKSTLDALLEDGKSLGIARSLAGSLEADRSRRLREQAREKAEKFKILLKERRADAKVTIKTQMKDKDGNVVAAGGVQSVTRDYARRAAAQSGEHYAALSTESSVSSETAGPAGAAGAAEGAAGAAEGAAAEGEGEGEGAGEGAGEMEVTVKEPIVNDGTPVDLDNDNSERDRLLAKARGKLAKGRPKTPRGADRGRHMPVVMNKTFKQDLVNVLSAFSVFDPRSGERAPDSLNAILRTRLHSLPIKQQLPEVHVRFPVAGLRPSPSSPSIPSPYSVRQSNTLIQPPALLFPAHWQEQEILAGAGLITGVAAPQDLLNSVRSVGSADDADEGVKQHRKHGKKRGTRSKKVSGAGPASLDPKESTI